MHMHLYAYELMHFIPAQEPNRQYAIGRQLDSVYSFENAKPFILQVRASKVVYARVPSCVFNCVYRGGMVSVAIPVLPGRGGLRHVHRVVVMHIRFSGRPDLVNPGHTSTAADD